MFKKDMLIPFVIIFIIVAILGSLLKTPSIILLLNGVDYFGTPFTYWSIDRLTVPDTLHFDYSRFLLDVALWGILSFLLSKLFLRIFRKKRNPKA